MARVHLLVVADGAAGVVAFLAQCGGLEVVAGLLQHVDQLWNGARIAVADDRALEVLRLLVGAPGPEQVADGAVDLRGSFRVSRPLEESRRLLGLAVLLPQLRRLEQPPGRLVAAGREALLAAVAVKARAQ